MSFTTQPDLASLIPKLDLTSSKDFASCAAYRQIPAIEGYLYPYQIRGSRCSRLSNAMLLLHHPGQGKTRIMASALEARRNSFGTGSMAIIITKGKIKNNTADDIDRLMGEKIPGTRDRKSFYKYFTYADFASRYGGYSDEDLHKEFLQASFAIDEVHSLVSYIEARGSNEESAFNLIARMRQILPNNLFVAMTATPMINQAGEIALVAKLLLPPNQGLQILGDMHPLDMLKLDVETCETIAKCMVDHLPVLYKEPHLAKRAYYGLSFFPDDKNAEHVKNYNQLEPNFHVDVKPGEKVRAFLEMGDYQREKYLETFSTLEVYKTARRTSIADADGLIELIEHCDTPPRVAEIGKYSALLKYWLSVELDAFYHGHWGVGAWYIEIVQDGVELFRKLLELYGWVDARHAPSRPSRYTRDVLPHQLEMNERPRYLILTGDDSVTANLHDLLTSDDNVQGTRIRTVVYSGSARDGINILNVLRGGAHTSWSEQAELQAISRHVRVNSLDALNKKISDPEFIKWNSKYIWNGEIVPIMFNAVVVPYLNVDRDTVTSRIAQYAGDDAITALSKIGWPYSIDLYMLQTQKEKTTRITRVFDILRNNSVDALIGDIPDVPEDNIIPLGSFDGYASSWMIDDAKRHFAKYTATEAFDVMTCAIQGLDRAERLRLVDSLFMTRGKSVGPRTRTSRFVTSYHGSIGHGPAPCFVDDEEQPAKFVLFPDTGGRGLFIDDRGAGVIREGLEEAIREFGLVFASQTPPTYDTIRPHVNIDLLILMAVYSRMWNVSYEGGRLRIGLCDLPQKFDQKAVPALTLMSPMMTFTFASDTVEISYARWTRNVKDRNSLGFFAQSAIRPNLSFLYVFPGAGGKAFMSSSHSSFAVEITLPVRDVYDFEMPVELNGKPLNVAKTLKMKNSSAAIDPAKLKRRGDIYGAPVGIDGRYDSVYSALIFPIFNDVSHLFDKPHDKQHGDIMEAWVRSVIIEKFETRWSIRDTPE